jgi:arylsulfatase A-like enzyme
LLTVGAIFRGPGVPASQTISDPSSTLDLSATFCDYAGAAVPDGVQSQSLRPLIENRPGASRKAAYCEWHLPPYRTGIELDLRIVRTQRHKFVLDLMSGDGELYDLENDPFELTNLFNDAESQKLRGELERLLKDRRDQY